MMTREQVEYVITRCDQYIKARHKTVRGCCFGTGDRLSLTGSLAVKFGTRPGLSWSYALGSVIRTECQVHGSWRDMCPIHLKEILTKYLEKTLEEKL